MALNNTNPPIPEYFLSKKFSYVPPVQPPKRPPELTGVDRHMEITPNWLVDGCVQNVA